MTAGTPPLYSIGHGSRTFDAFLELLRGGLADWVEDPEEPPSIKSRDPKDDYLIAAARAAQATLVTGDADLLELSGSIPVMSPRAFLKTLE